MYNTTDILVKITNQGGKRYPLDIPTVDDKVAHTAEVKAIMPKLNKSFI